MRAIDSQRAELLATAARKLILIQQRAETGDYEDIHWCLRAGITMGKALGAARALYPEFNPIVSLKALSYFDEVKGLPEDIKGNLRLAASKVRTIELS